MQFLETFRLRKQYSGHPLKKKVCFLVSGRVSICLLTETFPFLFFFFQKEKRKLKDFAAAQLGTILATRSTGSKLFLRVAPVILDVNVSATLSLRKCTKTDHLSDSPSCLQLYCMKICNELVKKKQKNLTRELFSDKAKERALVVFS